MKQFLFFLFQAAYTILANVIDDGFANKVNIDSVIAYGSYIPLIWAFQSFYNIGKYAYINTQKEGKTCFLLGFITSILMVLIGLPIYQVMHHMYQLTSLQITIFNKLLLCYLLTMPLRQVGDYINIYLMYQLKNKLVFWADALYWAISITLDVFVYINQYPVHYLVITTGISYFIYDVFLLYKSKILKEKLNKAFMKEAFLKGKDIVTNRVMGKVATLSYGVMAAQLSSPLYSIHCIVYGIVCNSEEFTNNFNIYCLSKLKLINNNIMTEAKKIIKKYGCILLLLEYGFAYLLLLFYHGTVSLTDCLPWLALYMTGSISLTFYETYKAVLSYYSKTEYIRYGGLIGIFIRIPVTFVLWKLGFGLLGFGLVYAIDFGSRAFYFFKMAQKQEKNDNNIERG